VFKGPPVARTETVNLAAVKTVFVVRYSAPHRLIGVLCHDYRTSKKPGPQELSKTLESLGFQTRILKETVSLGLFEGEKQYLVVKCRLNNPLERSFDSLREATEFRDQLRSLIEGPELKTDILER
jgi:hypothetical protein